MKPYIQIKNEEAQVQGQPSNGRNVPRRNDRYRDLNFFGDAD